MRAARISLKKSQTLAHVPTGVKLSRLFNSSITRKARLMDPRNRTPLPTWRNDDKLNGRLPHFSQKRRRAMHGIAIGTGVKHGVE